MNSIKNMRVKAGKKQIDMTLSVSDMSRLENGLYNATPEQVETICTDLDCTVDKLYDRGQLDYHYPPTNKSLRRQKREQELGIVKLTLRVSVELAGRFNAIRGGDTQAKTFERMVTEMEKDRHPRTRASGQQKNITATL